MSGKKRGRPLKPMPEPIPDSPGEGDAGYPGDAAQEEGRVEVREEV